MTGPRVTANDVGTLWTRDDGSLWRIIAFTDRPTVTWEAVDGPPLPREYHRERTDGRGNPLCANCGHTLACCTGKCDGPNDMLHVCVEETWLDHPPVADEPNRVSSVVFDGVEACPDCGEPRTACASQSRDPRRCWRWDQEARRV